MIEAITLFNQNLRGKYKHLPDSMVQCLGTIATKVEYLNLDIPDIPVFFVNLYGILDHLDNQSMNNNTLLNHCLAILETAVKHQKLKDALINDFRFISVVSQVLSRFPEETTKILALLEEMTYGIHFTKHEFYVDGLMKQLISIICEKSENSTQAFAILINLCFHNKECVYLVARLMNIKELAKLVASYGIYTCKFYMIFDYKENPKNQLKMSFNEIETALNANDYSRLKHVVDYVVSVKRLNGSEEFDTTLKGKIMEKITSITNVENYTSDETNRCINLLFSLLYQVMEKNEDDKEFLRSVVEVCLSWLSRESTSLSVMKVLSKALERDQVLNEDVLKSLKDHISVLVQQIREKKFTVEQMILLFELLLSVIECSNTRNIALDLFRDNFFDDLLKEIASTLEPSSKEINTAEYLQLFVYVLYTLRKLASTYPHEYCEMFGSVMKSYQTQKLLAQAFTQRNTAKIYQMLFRLSQTEEFSLEKMSVLLSNQNQIRTVNDPDEWKTPKIISAPPTIQVETRLDQIIDKLNSFRSSDLLTSEIVEAYKYKISSQQNEIEGLLERLSHAESTITRLSHEKQCLNAHVAKQQEDNFTKLLNYEALKKENQEMEAESNIIRRSVHEFNRSYEAVKKTNVVLTQTLKEKEDNIEKVTLEYKMKLKEAADEAKRRSEEFKKYFKQYEKKLEACQNDLKEKMQECDTAKHSVKELEKEKARLDELVKSLEKQIEKCKEELQEVDHMREIIFNVVSKKQKK